MMHFFFQLKNVDLFSFEKYKKHKTYYRCVYIIILQFCEFAILHCLSAISAIKKSLYLYGADLHSQTEGII